MATIPGASPGDTITGDDTGQAFVTVFNNVKINAGTGNDTVLASSDDNTVSGGDGDDTMQATGDGNLVSGGTGNDYIATSDDADNNLAHAGVGGDTMAGGTGADRFFGGSGNDSLDGGAGNDLLFGGSDDDILIGGAGNDSLIGGAGNDVFYFGPGFGNDTIADLSSGDEIHIVAGDYGGANIATAADVAAYVSAWVQGGAVQGSIITLGTNTIKIANVDPSDLDAANIANYVKVI